MRTQQQKKEKALLWLSLRRSWCMEQPAMSAFEKTPWFTKDISVKLLSILWTLSITHKDQQWRPYSCLLLISDSPRVHVLGYVGYLGLYPIKHRKEGTITWILNRVLLLKRLLKASMAFEVHLSLLQWVQCLELFRLVLSCSSNPVHELWISWVCKAKAENPSRMAFHAELNTPSFQASLGCTGVVASCSTGLTWIHQEL